jgi:hypothetical protein
MRVIDEELEKTTKEPKRCTLEEYQLALDLRDLREAARAFDFIDLNQVGAIADRIACNFDGNKQLSPVFLSDLIDAVRKLRELTGGKDA